MKFLVDECLSPNLVTIAQDQGYQATHVNWLGLNSKGDWAIVQRAVEDSYVIVTNNATDFTLLVGREEIHAGLVCLYIAPDRMSKKAQEDLFEYALNQLGGKEPINEVLAITLNKNGKVHTVRYEWPSRS